MHCKDDMKNLYSLHKYILEQRVAVLHNMTFSWNKNHVVQGLAVQGNLFGCGYYYLSISVGIFWKGG